MKKLGRILVCLVLVLGIGYFGLIPEVQAESKATTIKGLKEELANLKKQKSTNQANKNATKNSINQKKQAIYDAYNQKEQAEKDIEAANQKIIECNQKIEDTKKETEEVLKYNQLTSNQNVYLEYVMSADSLAEMSMRAKAISLITNYNREQIEYLADLITQNEQLKAELAQKKIDLDNAIISYNNAIASLDNYMTELEDVGDDINDQIKNQEALIKYYESICSSDTQLLSDCVKVLASTGFTRPVTKGVITSNFGSRINPLNGKTTSFHYGIDIGGTGYGAPVYAAANGMVAAITVKSSCGGNIIYVHHNVNGVAYTTQYAHLSAIYVKVGDTVTYETKIGAVGGSGATLKSNGGWDTCSTGTHLHYAIAKGHYLGGGANGYSSYSTFKSRNIDPGNYFPSKGVWFYNRYK